MPCSICRIFSVSSTVFCNSLTVGDFIMLYYCRAASHVKDYFQISSTNFLGGGCAFCHRAFAADLFKFLRLGCWPDFFPPIDPILRRKSFTCGVVACRGIVIPTCCGEAFLSNENLFLCQSRSPFFVLIQFCASWFRGPWWRACAPACSPGSHASLPALLTPCGCDPLRPAPKLRHHCADLALIWVFHNVSLRHRSLKHANQPCK